MTIATYTDLQTAIQNWMDWTDSVATARIPECILLFESYANRKLRTRKMITTATLSPTGDPATATLPSDFAAVKNIIWTGTPVNSLEEYDDFLFQQFFGTPGAAAPARAYNIRGTTLLVGPNSTTNLTLVYYQRIPPLASNSTNWLLTDHPDVYLYGALVEANAFRVNATAAGLWKGRRDEVIQELNVDYSRGPAPAAKVIGATP